MARPHAGRKENHVEALRAGDEIGVAGDVIFGGADDAAGVHRQQGIAFQFTPAAGFDLDEDGGAEAAGDEVEFADRRLVAGFEDAVALEAQEPGGESFAAAAVDFGALADAILGL